MNKSYDKYLRKSLLGLIACILVSFVASASSVVVPMGDDDFVVIPLTARAPTVTPTGFDYVRQNERILTNFPIGHDLPKATNELFYNLELDGYGGLPFGSCLRRGYLLPNSDPSKDLCTANENKDLMRVWSNRNPNLKNVLLKNMTIKNAYRTYNVVDGTVVKTSSALPHTDTFQSFYAGSSQENPDWLGIQDTIIKNSDNNLMIHGGSRFKGAVYQNLHTGCDSEFAADDRTRHLNDYAEFFPNDEPRPSYSCTNSMGFSSTVSAPIWLINVKAGNDGTSPIQITNQNARVVVVSVDSSDWKIRTRDRNRKLVEHPNVRRYPTIEAALRTESRPPFIELSCSGWATPPRGCESRRGYLD